MIKIENLSKTYATGTGQVSALRGISFRLEAGEFYTLLGPSGCGKSTTLRCIAGFEIPEEGEIWMGDELVFSRARRVNLPPHKRDFGIVFQSYAIWPHMNVFENVAFPLLHGRKRTAKAEVKERVRKVLRLVQLEGLADRPVPFLSGGQQQRVALARALVHEPGALLLDEPLSNLDAQLREEMRMELRGLLKRLNITTLYVTHDQLEALTMSDRLAVMHAGSIVQEGLPRELYQAPADKFVARFIGQANFLRGRLCRIGNNGCGTVDLTSALLDCTLSKSMLTGDEVLVMIRPEDVVLWRESNRPEKNFLEGRVESTCFTGDSLDCWVAAGEQRIRIRLHPSNLVEDGHTISICLPPDRCRCVPLSS